MLSRIVLLALHPSRLQLLTKLLQLFIVLEIQMLSYEDLITCPANIIADMPTKHSVWWTPLVSTEGPINQIIILPWLGIFFNSKWTIRNGKKDGFTKKLAIIFMRRTVNGLIPVLPILVAKALYLGSKERSNTWIGPLYWRAWKINSLFNKDFIWKLEYLITRVNVVNINVICKVARTSNENPQFH
jgi:hypothetical protein